jgi:hypothetical protein
MYDNTIPDEARLSLYLSARYLQELQLALRLIDVPSTYVRPGIGGYGLPQLHVGPAEYDPEALGEPDGTIAVRDDFICALPFVLSTQRLSWTDPEPEWRFMWCWHEPLQIWQAVDMMEAARIIAGQLFEGVA